MIWGCMAFSMQRALGEALPVNFGGGGSGGSYFLAAALAGDVIFIETDLAVAEVAGFWRQVALVVFGGAYLTRAEASFGARRLLLLANSPCFAGQQRVCGRLCFLPF